MILDVISREGKLIHKYLYHLVPKISDNANSLTMQEVHISQNKYDYLLMTREKYEGMRNLNLYLQENFQKMLEGTLKLPKIFK